MIIEYGSKKGDFWPRIIVDYSWAANLRALNRRVLGLKELMLSSKLRKRESIFMKAKRSQIASQFLYQKIFSLMH